MKFNTEKCKVLHLGRNKSVHQYRLGPKCLQKSFAEENQRALADNKLNVSQQCACVAKKSNNNPGLHEEQQQVLGGDPSSPLSTEETISRILCLCLCSGLPTRQIRAY